MENLKKTFSECDDVGLPLFMANIINAMGPRLDSRQWNMMLLYNVSRPIILHEVKLVNRKLENKFAPLQLCTWYTHKIN